MKIPHENTTRPAVVVMAKQTVPGRVKTRLQTELTPNQAAQVHQAMLACVLERLPEMLPTARFDFVLALDIEKSSSQEGGEIPGLPPVAAHWRIVSQGTGDLGARICHIWESERSGRSQSAPMFFLGVDSPDVPANHFHKADELLARVDVVLGSVPDGGYWMIASNNLHPELFTNIDWGTSTVYHQTIDTAARAGLSFADAGSWFDVDEPADLRALMIRLASAEEPILKKLRQRLSRFVPCD